MIQRIDKKERRRIPEGTWYYCYTYTWSYLPNEVLVTYNKFIELAYQKIFLLRGFLFFFFGRQQYGYLHWNVYNNASFD